MAAPRDLSQSFDLSRADAGPARGQPALGWRNWVNVLAYAVNAGVTAASLAGAFGETNTTLSKKYQTLVTPAGWAFSIWGPIFIWELVFALAQFAPQLRASEVVRVVTPWWAVACAFQAAWSVFFGREAITVALICMLGILGSLLGLILAADRLKISLAEYWLLRAPFSLHAGWIIAASAVNANVLADANRAAPATLLSLAICSLAAIFALVAIFVVAVPKPDAIISLVAAWALAGVRAELVEAKNLLDPGRFNPYAWGAVELGGVRGAAWLLCLACLGLAAIALLLRASRRCMPVAMQGGKGAGRGAYPTAAEAAGAAAVA